jgi:peptide/nickel transport system substrate-binding protein
LGDCTADDVVFSLARVMDEKTGSPHRGKLKKVNQARAIDKETVEITLKRPCAPMLASLCNGRTGTLIVSRKAVEKYGDDFGKKPDGAKKPLR